jgi:DNA-binding NarL/FixJ family response regulator
MWQSTKKTDKEGALKTAKYIQRHPEEEPRQLVLMKQFLVKTQDGVDKVGAGDRFMTRREREIFTLLAPGYDNEQIAGRFDLSPQTVRNQASTIYSEPGVKNRFEIIRLANKPQP